MALGKHQPQKRLSRDVRLHAFLSGRVQEMQAAIQQKAIADFNVWLVNSVALTFLIAIYHLLLACMVENLT